VSLEKDEFVVFTQVNMRYTRVLAHLSKSNSRTFQGLSGFNFQGPYEGYDKENY